MPDLGNLLRPPSTLLSLLEQLAPADRCDQRRVDHGSSHCVRHWHVGCLPCRVDPYEGGADSQRGERAPGAGP